MEPLQGKPTEIISTNCYSGSDTPPEDKPYRPRGLWESLTTVVESVTLQLLYASNEVIGYELLLTLQEDSLSPQPFLWIPVVATVVVGWLSRNRWNPETPLFNQLDEQEFNKQHELQIISFMFEPPSNSSHSSMVLFGTPQPNYPHSLRFYNTWANTHGGSNGGGWQESQHTLGDNCYIGGCWGRCQYALPNEALLYDNHYGTDQYKNVFADGYGQQTYGQANTEKDYTGGTNHSTHPEGCLCDNCLGSNLFFCSTSESTDTTIHFTSMNSNSCTTEATSTALSKPVTIANPSSNYVVSAEPSEKKCKQTHLPSDQRPKRPKTHECDKCGYKTDRASILERHKQTHLPSDQRPKAHECDKCNYKTDRASSLKAHKQTHLPADERHKAHECDKCNYKTDRAGNLKTHKQTHLPSDQRPKRPKIHECDQCDYITDHTGHMNKHKRTRHPATGPDNNNSDDDNAPANPP
ncbi:C2H2-type zinc finger protein [Endozoicomonas montiporae]|uniref:C2H2-type zinc finger protein n=1 Tax=Endozoicomonas montiporae TaxID=1027273 RepID=UPI00126859F5|nr:C2H2-type zinc finger protein [Endozoicomonas montiporae]